MKSKLHIAIVMAILSLATLSCKKDPAVNIESFEITRENLNVGANVATITGTYSYAGVIDGMEACVSEVETGLNVGTFPATLDGNGFSVEISGLSVGTTYSYYYSVDYGVSRPYTTGSKTFTTITESPTVQTLEVLALDSTTFRVKCEVLSGGGQEVIERGVCYNTYGDPTMDDATLQHASGGLGQYTIRMENLALGKKYYVRAYAKNAVGIGLGEEMEFETPAPPGMPVSIVLSCDPEEGGSVSGGGTYSVGSQCTVTATANAGYTFVNWTENGNQVSTDATYTFDVTRECNLVANFTTQAYVITAEVTPENSGTVTGAGGYNHGEECTLTATAKPGYEFVKWTKNGSTVSSNATFTFAVTTSATYVAHFQTKSYTINLSASPSNGGSVTGGGTFNYGQSCTVRATSAEGYTFVNWTDGGDEVSTDVNYTFTVTGDRALVASFTLQTTTPTVITNDVANITQTTATGGGNVTSDGGATITERGICWSTSHNPTTNGSYANNGTGTGTYTVQMSGLIPGTIYYVRAYAKNSQGLSYGDEVSFTTILPNYTISVSGTPSFGGSVSGGGTYQQGQSCTVSATANNGYMFTKWTQNGNTVSTNANYTFVVNSNRTLMAHFEEQAQSYTINVSSNPSNGGAVTGGGTYQQGQSCTVSATANMGYTFTNWTENGNVVSTNANYTFTVTGNRILMANFSAQGTQGWLYYDDGTYAMSTGAGSTIYWGSMFPTSMLTQYSGTNLTKVAIHTSYVCSATVNVYLGGTNAPAVLMSTQTFTMAGNQEFMEVTLNNPVAIDGTQNLWITFYQSGENYPADACADTGDANNRWVSSNGANWTDLATAGLPGYGWMIRGFVTNGAKKEEIWFEK